MFFKTSHSLSLFLLEQVKNNFEEICTPFIYDNLTFSTQLVILNWLKLLIKYFAHLVYEDEMETFCFASSKSAPVCEKIIFGTLAWMIEIHNFFLCFK